MCTCRRCRPLRADGHEAPHRRSLDLTVALAQRSSQLVSAANQLRSVLEDSGEPGDHVPAVANLELEAQAFASACRKSLLSEEKLLVVDPSRVEALGHSDTDLLTVCDDIIKTVDSAMRAYGVDTNNCGHVERLQEMQFDPHKLTPSDMLHLFWLGLVEDITKKLAEFFDKYGPALCKQVQDVWENLPWRQVPFNLGAERFLHHSRSMNGVDYHRVLKVS